MTTNTPSIAGMEFLSLVRDNGSTRIWKARQTSLDRPVTVKFLYGDAANDAEQRSDFIGIARAFARIRHPGIVEVYDVVEDCAEPYIVTEWAEGPTIAEAVADAHGPLPIRTALRATSQVCQALEAIWIEQRLLIRNIKPTEIRLSQDQAKIVNFPLAVRVPPGSDAYPSNGEVVGTPHFSAPEQLRGKPIDFRSEMFALGATLYSMLTGHPPYADMDARAIIANERGGIAVSPRDLNPKVTPATAALVARMMMRSPSDRHSTWRELQDEIAYILSGKPPRRLPGETKGESLVAPPSAPAAGAATPADEAATQADAKGSKGGGAAAFGRGLLWLLLVAWLVLLGNYRMDNPLRLPRPLSGFDGFGSDEGEDEGEPVVPGLTPDIDPYMHREQPNAGLPSPAVAAVADAPAKSDPAAPATIRPQDDDAPALPREAALALAASLADKGIGDAISSLDSLGLDAGLAGEVRDALSAIPDSDEIVMENLLERKDEIVTIVYMGKERSIRPLRGVNGELFTEFIAPGHPARPVSFPIGKLSAEERLRWMSTPETPGEHAAYCLLAMRAGLPEKIAPHAPECGVLEPVFRAAAELIEQSGGDAGPEDNQGKE